MARYPAMIVFIVIVTGCTGFMLIVGDFDKLLAALVVVGKVRIFVLVFVDSTLKAQGLHVA